MEKRGLSEIEARERLRKDGLNEIKEVSHTTPFKIFLRQVKSNFIIYLLLVAMVLSFFIGKAATAYTILAVIFMVIIVGFVQEYRAEKVIKSLREMIMPVSIVIRDGREREISSKELVVGDVIVLRNGDKIPADCLVLEENELLVNESILTGESREITKKVVTDEKSYTDENMIFMGTFVVNGKCVARVVHAGMNTKFGKISEMIARAEKEMPLQNKINKITRYMAVLAIVFSVLTGLITYLIDPSVSSAEILVLVIALMVSAFPEGFPVVLITALAHGAYRMAKQNAIVNRMSIIETLGETTIICSDKTGTITKGEMTVVKLFVDNQMLEITGSGYDADGKFLLGKDVYDIRGNPAGDLLLKCGVLCNDSWIQRKGNDNDYHVFGSPTESSLLILGAKAGMHKEDLHFDRIGEVPFNSQRKTMSVLVKSDREHYVFLKGAVEIVLGRCKFVQRHDGIFKLTEMQKRRILALNRKLTSGSLRTLALACKSVKTFDKDHFEEDLVLLGITAIQDPPREEVKDSIDSCRKAGIKVKMITGDDKDTAVSIGRQVGLVGRVMEGSELDKLTEEELSKVVNEIAIFARVKPEHKIKIVRALKMNSEIVTMTGDGVNDAPALKEAHIGVAMGKNGTDVSRDVADLTLRDDDFSTIVKAIKEGRTIFKNIKKFVSYQLSCNHAELAILFFGVLLSPLLGWKIPLLLALQILFMNLVTDDLPAITLGFTPASRDIMSEKPRKRRELLDRYLFAWLIIAGVLMAFLTLAVFFIQFNLLDHNTEYARTSALITLIFLEIGGAFNFMSFRREVFGKALFANRYLFYASAISIFATLVIIYTPLNVVFSTVPVGFAGWGIALVSALLIILVFNLLKKYNNKYNWFDFGYN